MKKLRAAFVMSALTLILTCALTYSASPIVAIEDCFCSAPDGTCSGSISCQGGCILHCVGDGECYGECSGFYQMFATETTVQMQNATYSQLVAKLARISGKDLAFSPSNPDTMFNAEYKKALYWDVLDILSNRGKVQIAGKDFEKLKRLRRTLLSGERISLCVGNTPVHTFVNDMAGLTGLPLRITAGKPMAMVNVKLQNVSLSDILVKVSEQTGTKIIEEGADTNPQ